MKKFIQFIFLLFLLSGMYAQDFTSHIDRFFDQNHQQYQLNATDVSDLQITSQGFSQSMNIHTVFVQQRYQNIEIFNALSVLGINQAGEIKTAKVDFINSLQQRINTTTPTLTPADAIVAACAKLGITLPTNLQMLEQQSTYSYLFNTGEISFENIPVKLVFQPNEDFSQLRLAWDLSIYPKNIQAWYSVRIDALTGDLLSTHNWMTDCRFDTEHYQYTNLTLDSEQLQGVLTWTPNDGSVYRVYALPIESPNHGNHSLESQPGDPIASPFGWHDTNGVVGPEYTITRGNNVRARADLAGNNSGNSAEGGPDLEFDFPYNFNQPPIGHVNASITNLFYWNNIIHDIFVQYGFDEPNWNFQQTNYSGQGLGNDYVNADAQDGSGTNNANFATPPEGNNPRMQMYLWDNNGMSELLTINNGPLAGGYSGIEAAFGEPVPTSPLTANMVLVTDSGSNPYDACETITNGGAINGKIAVIHRGGCEFGFKALAAQNMGAVAVIIVNNEAGPPILMGAGEVGDLVTIPTIMISQADGDPIIASLSNGDNINATLLNEGPFAFDSSLDTGIIIHEYGHGISNRLTGGGFNVSCLQNDEQMGEGWSDYFGLMLTMKEGDTRDQNRGVGTYVVGQPIDGQGIRPAPYNTNMAVNPYTYGDTNNSNISRPHGIGFVWATMLWDLTWDLIDKNGYDTDIYFGTGGNNIALQLVVDGLKIQNCSPGFVNGRDAIIEADQLANDGENYCIIWRAFAKRGLGLNASQGSAHNRFDQVEDFTVPEECILGTSTNDLNQFMIFPNPTDGLVHIVSRYDMGTSQITLYDINGRQVISQSQHLNGVNQIDLGHLETGIYILQITGDSYTYNTRIIIK